MNIKIKIIVPQVKNIIIRMRSKTPPIINKVSPIIVPHSISGPETTKIQNNNIPIRGEIVQDTKTDIMIIKGLRHTK